MAAAHVALTAAPPFFMVAPALALRQKLPPAERVRDLLAYVLPGENLERQGFLQHLLDGGYVRRRWWRKGEFSVGAASSTCFRRSMTSRCVWSFGAMRWSPSASSTPPPSALRRAWTKLLVLPASEVVLDGQAREHALAGRKRRQDPQFWKISRRAATFPHRAPPGRILRPAPDPVGYAAPGNGGGGLGPPEPGPGVEEGGGRHGP